MFIHVLDDYLFTYFVLDFCFQNQTGMIFEVSCLVNIFTYHTCNTSAQSIAHGGRMRYVTSERKRCCKVWHYVATGSSSWNVFRWLPKYM